MRIITGTARGRKLKAPIGADTRPSSDRIKENMFNILHFHLEGRRVLDLFAGSGQLGLEALSRGAARCVFVDNNAGALQSIRENLAHTRLLGGEVVACDAVKFIDGNPEKYDIILLDPPYRAGLFWKTLEAITENDILHPGGLILAECASDEAVFEAPSPYFLQKSYNYGSKKIVLYTRQ
ncbi:MAG: 16S rRNA (guanine(966)-N(2))-methyltransferase RsmD [Oscillospiraceae bacterium]|nr:16S rRNA (guanine(966)-N(2))-methyltransferase RsmD [Oscillospiraceae bacterium]